MTFGSAILWSLLRSLLIALFGWYVARGLQRHLQSYSRDVRWKQWILILTPFFIPALLTGYCYRDTAVSLVHWPVLKEILYASVVLFQVVPVAVVLFWFSPAPAVSKSQLHLASLVKLPTRERWRLWIRSSAQYDIAAASTLFLLAFQEAEFSALLQAASWTEWLFTKHALGLRLDETLRLVVIPIVVQLPFMLPLILWLARDDSEGIQESSADGRRRAWPFVWFTLSWLIVIVIPVKQLFRSVWRSGFSLDNQPTLMQELGDSLLLAITGGLIAFLSAWLLTKTKFSSPLEGRGRVRGEAWNRNRPSPQPSCRGRGSFDATTMLRFAVLFTCLIPGLMGNLAWGLSLSGLFQTSLLQWAYDTPVPLILGEVMYVLPRTLILFRCLDRRISKGALHQLVLLQRGSVNHKQTYDDLKWRLTSQFWFWSVVLVCFWVYLELMLPSLLVYPGMAPLTLVLYNTMHYGRISVLGTKLLFALLVPIVITISLLAVRRPMSRLFRT